MQYRRGGSERGGLTGGLVAKPVAFRGDLAGDSHTVLPRVGFLVRLVAEILKFEVEMVRPEDVAELEEGIAGVVVAAGVHQGTDFAVATGGETNEALRVSTQGVEGDNRGPGPGGVGEVRSREETAEIGIAFPVLGEKHQMVRVAGCKVIPTGRGRLPLAHKQRFRPDLGSEDRLDAVLGAGFGKADRPVKAVVVGESQGRLFQLSRPGGQLLDPATAI